MLRKNLGLSVEVMLRMYAAWLEGATDSDIRAIKHAMEKDRCCVQGFSILVVQFLR